MFQVRRNNSEENPTIFNVFAVKEDENGNIKFLMHHDFSNEWEWENANKYEPVLIDYETTMRNNIPLMREICKEINILNESGDINA